MKKSLFEYAILWHPTEKEIKDKGLETTLVIGPTTILASTQDEAKMAAAMMIPAKYKKQLGQVEVRLRAF